MINANQIKPDMPVFCSEDGQFSEEDHMEGYKTIKLKRDKPEQHHYIPVSWVTYTENNKVKVNLSGKQTMQDWTTTTTRL